MQKTSEYEYQWGSWLTLVSLLNAPAPNVLEAYQLFKSLVSQRVIFTGRLLTHERMPGLGFPNP